MPMMCFYLPSLGVLLGIAVALHGMVSWIGFCAAFVERSFRVFTGCWLNVKDGFFFRVRRVFVNMLSVKYGSLFVLLTC